MIDDELREDIEKSMRDYHRKKGKYILPASVYHQTLWIIRDYDRMREELHDIAVSSPPPPDGQPRGSGTADEVFSKVRKRERLSERVAVIETELYLLPAEYQRGVWDNIQSNKPYPLDAGRATYSLYKSRYIHNVAKKLKII